MDCAAYGVTKSQAQLSAFSHWLSLGLSSALQILELDKDLSWVNSIDLCEEGWHYFHIMTSYPQT